jgi:hypothetical protein
MIIPRISFILKEIIKEKVDIVMIANIKVVLFIFPEGSGLLLFSG